MLQLKHNKMNNYLEQKKILETYLNNKNLSPKNMIIIKTIIKYLKYNIKLMFMLVLLT